jgi:hypothetical protein
MTRERAQLVRLLLADLAGAAPAAPALPALEDADREKVGPHVLGLLGASGRLTPELERDVERIARKRRVLDEEAHAIAAAARDAAVRLVFVRGFALQALYPAGYVRQFNDLDLLVATEDEAARLLERLRRAGYGFSRVPLTRRNLAGRGPRRWVGLPLNRMRDDLDEPVIVDMHVGGPSITAQTHLALPEAVFERPALAAGLPVLDPTWSALSLLAELFDRRELVARDFLDLDRALRAPVRWHELVREASSFCLRPQARRAAADAAAAGLDPLVAVLRRVGGRAGLGSGARSAEALHLLGRVVRESPWRAPARLAAVAAGPIVERLEDRWPAAALRAVRALGARPADALGLSLYLFAGEGRGDLAVVGSRWLARLRPLVDEDELDRHVRLVCTA